MTSIKLTVTGAAAKASVFGLLTDGMVGIPVEITYDSDWNGLTKHLVCRSGQDVRTILNVENSATVAHEVMIAGRGLFLGVEGRNSDGTLVIPTIWAYCGMIFDGANADADPTADPTPPIWAQLEQRVSDLEENGTGGGSIIVDDEGYLTTTAGGFEIDEDGYIIL